MTNTQAHISVEPSGRITRHSKDKVGNNLMATLHWCDTHLEPVWVYNDKSFKCAYDQSTGSSTSSHNIHGGPWERT